MIRIKESRNNFFDSLVRIRKSRNTFLSVVSNHESRTSWFFANLWFAREKNSSRFFLKRRLVHKVQNVSNFFVQKFTVHILFQRKNCERQIWDVHFRILVEQSEQLPMNLNKITPDNLKIRRNSLGWHQSQDRGAFEQRKKAWKNVAFLKSYKVLTWGTLVLQQSSLSGVLVVNSI